MSSVPLKSIASECCPGYTSPGDKKTEQERLSEVVNTLLSKMLDEDLKLPPLVVCGEQSSGKSSVLEAISGIPFPRTGTETCSATRIKDFSERHSLLKVNSCYIEESSSTERTKAPNSILRKYQAAGEYYDFPNEGASLFQNLYQQHWGWYAWYLESEVTSYWRSLNTAVIGFDDMNRSHTDVFSVIFSCLIEIGWLTRELTPEKLVATAENLNKSREPCGHHRLVSRETAYWTADGGTPRKVRGRRKTMAYWQSLHASTQPQSHMHLMLGGFGSLLPEPSKPQFLNPGIHEQRDYAFAQEARDQRALKISNPFIGDEGIGPEAGKPNMGREDDDDDDCVGFRRFSGPRTESGGLLYEGGDRHGKASPHNLQVCGTRGSIPKYGPPKRDPVAAAMSSPVNHPLDESTLRTWRDAIARTCGGGANLGPMKAGKWEDGSCQSDGNERYCDAHGKRDLLCAY